MLLRTANKLPHRKIFNFFRKADAKKGQSAADINLKSINFCEPPEREREREGGKERETKQSKTDMIVKVTKWKIIKLFLSSQGKARRRRRKNNLISCLSEQKVSSG